MCFKDLYLTRVFSFILQKEKDEKISHLYFTPVKNKETIKYRQGVFNDLNDSDLASDLTFFSNAVRQGDKAEKSAFSGVGRNIRDTSNHSLLVFARGACGYASSIFSLGKRLKNKNNLSLALSSFKEYISEYANSETFKEFNKEACELERQLNDVHYEMLFDDSTLRIRKYQGEKDINSDAKRLFEKFAQPLYEKPYITPLNINRNVEENIADLLAKNYKGLFDGLFAFAGKWHGYVDKTLLQAAEEAEFYLDWLQSTDMLKKQGLPFCLPEISSDREEKAEDIYELSMAYEKGTATIVNSYVLKRDESFLIISGPNQGGKTTFARAFGQIHYLFSLGLTVPGTSSKLCLFDSISTLFASSENKEDGFGQLKSDFVKLHDVISKVSEDSFVIINEIFASTSSLDALALFKKTIGLLLQKKARGVIVTFLEEIVAFAPGLVSMVSLMNSDKTLRTYHIVRQKADGRSYALGLAESQGLSEDQIKKRLSK